MRFRRLAAVAAVLTVVVAGGCGASPDGPGEQISFQDAFEAVANQDTVEVQVRFVGAADDVAAFMDDGYTDPAENARYAAILLDSALAVASGKDGTFGVDVKIGGIEHAIELRAAGTTMAARGQIGRIAEMFGASQEDVADGLNFLRQMGKGEVADALLDGTWISADLGPMESFMKGIGGGAGAGFPDLSAMQEQSEKLMAALSGMFAEVVSSEFVATTGAGHHHRLTANTRELFEAFLPVMKDFYGDLIPESEYADMGDVPDQDITADAWIHGGRLSRLEIDLTQFHPAPGPVVLRFDLPAEPTRPSMPDGGVEIDVMEIMGSFFGLGMDSFDDIQADETFPR